MQNKSATAFSTWVLVLTVSGVFKRLQAARTPGAINWEINWPRPWLEAILLFSHLNMRVRVFCSQLKLETRRKQKINNVLREDTLVVVEDILAVKSIRRYFSTVDISIIGHPVN